MEKNRNDEPQTAPENDTPEQENQDLEAELEDIREMFQRELDKASEDVEIEDEQEIIQELSDCETEGEAEGTPEDESEEVNLCECCMEKPRSDKRGEDYPYCEECRELMKKYPLRLSGIVMVLIMITVFMMSVYFSMNFVGTMETYMKASQLANQDKHNSSVYSIIYSSDDSSSLYSLPRRTFDELIDSLIKIGGISDASTIISNTYSEKELEKLWNKKYADVVNEYTVLNETVSATQEVYQTYAEKGDFDCEEVLAELDKLKTVNPIKEGKSNVAEKYDEVFIERYKIVVMEAAGKTYKELLEQYKVIDSIGKGKEWLYLAAYCELAAKSGDEALAKELMERALKINKEDMNAYMAYASYYRFMEKPDGEKMLEVCNEAKTNACADDYTYMPYMAIAYLLKGDGASALTTMSDYVSLAGYSVSTCNLFALCAVYNGNGDVYESMESMLSNSGYELADVVTQYKEGKITIVEALQSEGGEMI